MVFVGSRSGNQSAKAAGHDEREAMSIGLSFTGLDGPLVAIAGLCGGAGASLFSYLLGLAAARESSGRVLLCDLGGPAATISNYAGLSSDHSILQAARYIAKGGRPPGQPFAQAKFGLRMICRPPEAAGSIPLMSAMKIVSDAKRAHALTVLDCGGLQRSVECACLKLATHVVWVLPATTIGLNRASALLQTLDIAPVSREIVLARTDHGARKAPLSDLADLADGRRAPLLLMESVEDPLDSPVETVIGQTALTMQALAGLLMR
jgi:hypothetical protein